MDGLGFDQLTRRLAEGATRRGVLRTGMALAGAALGLRGLRGAEARRTLPLGYACIRDSACTSGYCGPADTIGRHRCACPDGLVADGNGGCSFSPPAVCTSGTDATSGDPWVVCRADADSAWVSSAPPQGGYNALAICQQLGYASVGQHGGTCGSVCGYCEGSTGCSAPGNEFFDFSEYGGGGLFGLVHWQCLA